MKAVVLAFTLLLGGVGSSRLMADTDLQRVTIYADGAEVWRSQDVTVRAGQQTVSFSGLSPHIDKGSVQVKAGAGVTIMGISHRYVYPDSAKIADSMKRAEQKYADAQRTRRQLEARREVLQSQLEMVKANCNVGTRTVATPLADIKAINNYYRDEQMAIRSQLIALDDETQRALEAEAICRQAVDSIANIKLRRQSVVDVRVQVERPGMAHFALSYYVGGAGWYATYDLRSPGAGHPVELGYKACIAQHTGEDWRNVAVTLSSANPNRTNVAPRLRPYLMDYGLAPPSYDYGDDNSRVSGTVRDAQGKPIAGASIVVKGTQIATVADADGRYALTLPEGKRTLTASYIGYVRQSRTVSRGRLDFQLELSSASNDAGEDAVLASLQGRVAGFDGGRLRGRKAGASMMMESAAVVEDAPRAKARRTDDDDDIVVESRAGRFGYEFAIATPLTILSDAAPVTTQVGKYELPTTYVCKAVPKIDHSAFLIADAIDWADLHLVEGEASVYYDGGYVGTTLIDPTQQSDTLHLSMGRDNGIQVDRKAVKSKGTRRTLASHQTQQKEWEISLRNTRREAVDVTVYDQVPVSQNGDITVSVAELSGGHLDAATGIVTWQVHLDPGETKALTLSYQVKYARNKWLTVE